MGLVLVPRMLGPLDVRADVVAYDEDVTSVDLEHVEFFVPIYMGPPANLALMGRMGDLQVCQMLTAGYENALPYLPAGVTLCNAAGVHDASTAELALGLIIASLRGIDDAARDMHAGRWDHRTRPALADKEVVIVGAGGVGTAIHRRLEPFECAVTLVGRTARNDVRAVGDLPGLLPRADIVVLAVPLDPSTARLADAGFLARMKDGALLVNVARGGVVDTPAIVDEVASGRLRAALDVTDPEPLPPDHPLWRLPGVLITPHLGGDSSAFVPRARRLVAKQIGLWQRGESVSNVVASGH